MREREYYVIDICSIYKIDVSWYNLLLECSSEYCTMLFNIHAMSFYIYNVNFLGVNIYLKIQELLLILVAFQSEASWQIMIGLKFDLACARIKDYENEFLLLKIVHMLHLGTLLQMHCIYSTDAVYL